MSIHVLGIDPGFASIGYAIVEIATDGTRSVLRGENDEPLMGVLETAKSDKKRAVKASDDNLRRTRELARMMLPLVSGDYDIRVVCLESMSFPRSSSVAQKMGICWGVIGTLVEMTSLSVVQSSPQEIKKTVCGAKDASKEHIQTELARKYHLDLDSFAKSKREHCFDALGAVEAAVDSEIIRLACRMGR